MGVKHGSWRKVTLHNSTFISTCLPCNDILEEQLKLWQSELTNYLKGKDGDKINAILAGSGFNIRKLLRAVLLWLFKERFRGITTDITTLIEMFS